MVSVIHCPVIYSEQRRFVLSASDTLMIVESNLEIATSSHYSAKGLNCGEYLVPNLSIVCAIWKKISYVKVSWRRIFSAIRNYEARIL